MGNRQAEQWAIIAASLKEATKEQREVLESHSNAFNRGWIAGLSSAQQQALMFRHSALKTGDLIPKDLRAERSKDLLFRDYRAFLIENAKAKTENLAKEAFAGNHPMDNETVAFRYGWLSGLENWQGNKA